MSDNLPLWTHVDGHLLDPSLRAGVDEKDGLSIGNSAREQATRRNDPGLGVHDDIRNRHQNRALVIALDHRLTVLAFWISVPDLGNSVDLGFVGRRHNLHRHSQNGLVDRRVGLELVHLTVYIRINNIGELDPFLLGDYSIEAPPVFGRAHGYGIGGEVDLPLFPEFGFSIEVEEGVEVLDYPRNSLLYLFRIQLEFLDQPVNLVNVKDGPDTLLEGLSRHGLCLNHYFLNRIDHNYRSVNSPERSSDFAREIYVTGRID